MIPIPGATRFMVAEKWGALMVFDDEAGANRRSVVLNLSGRVQVEGDSGLLGVAFHPEFGVADSPNRSFLYVFYRYTPDPLGKDRAYCRLSRFSWQGGLAAIDPGSEQVLINQYDRH
ncbi:MAG: PQQ-dependent sugar dehydrogenase, partial [Verrucomicrobia bacterium]|nr:PQQ-dependent sugar dehydrogenase [Verrucomicrobiota bacterium]